ncbi:hypothetical protein F5Y10DRAFT_71607 [Nemania abortiva]|nr:hypothetical protein F5Y10DRAFT_71607 [Nemania abortiva]
MSLTRILRTSNTQSLKKAFQTPPTPIMSAQKSSVAIALVGLHTEIGAPVAEGLRPEWDVTRFIQSFEAAKADLPYLLSGEAPPNPPTNDVGSGTYSSPVRAVVFGRGFTQQQAEELHALYNDLAPSVVWLAGSAATRPAGAGPPANVEKTLVPMFRAKLEELVKDGAEGGLVLY